MAEFQLLPSQATYCLHISTLSSLEQLLPFGPMLTDTLVWHIRSTAKSHCLYSNKQKQGFQQPARWRVVLLNRSGLSIPVAAVTNTWEQVQTLILWSNKDCQHQSTKLPQEKNQVSRPFGWFQWGESVSESQCWPLCPTLQAIRNV